MMIVVIMVIVVSMMVRRSVRLSYVSVSVQMLIGVGHFHIH
jgi:hypothetical protein